MLDTPNRWLLEGFASLSSKHTRRALSDTALVPEGATTLDRNRCDAPTRSFA